MNYTAAIWIGLTISEENSYIGSFDHDFCESGPTILDHKSPELKELVEKKAQEMGIDLKGKFVFALYSDEARNIGEIAIGEVNDTKYEGVARIYDSEPGYFLGVFEY